MDDDITSGMGPAQMHQVNPAFAQIDRHVIVKRGGVMGQLLGRGIIHLAVIGTGDGAGGFALWCQADLEVDIVQHRTGVAQVRQ